MVCTLIDHKMTPYNVQNLAVKPLACVYKSMAVDLLNATAVEQWRWIFDFVIRKEIQKLTLRVVATQRQNECACSADLWFERESITNAPFQSPNSHLLPQYFFCWIRYVMEEVRRNLSWKRQPYLFWFGLIHAKRKQTIGILKMPPFCRVRLLTGDEHAHSFCRCVGGSHLL